MGLNKTTPEQVLAAVKIELSLTLKRLIGCQNSLYRQTGSYPDDLAAAIQASGISVARHHGRADNSEGSEGRSGEA
jgi:hypothetical protein